MARTRTVLMVSALTLAAVIGVAGCDGNGSTGGITIPSSDSTDPTLSFGVGATDQPTAKATVDSGGSDATVTLTVRTGSLNLLATAKDPESGVQKVEIWMNETKTTCDSGGTCTKVGPGLLSGPISTASEPQKQPGDTTTETSLLADAVDLATHIGSAPSGGTYDLVWEFWAEARNHLGGTVKSPTITVRYSQP